MAFILLPTIVFGEVNLKKANSYNYNEDYNPGATKGIKSNRQIAEIDKSILRYDEWIQKSWAKKNRAEFDLRAKALEFSVGQCSKKLSELPKCDKERIPKDKKDITGMLLFLKNCQDFTNLATLCNDILNHSNEVLKISLALDSERAKELKNGHNSCPQSEDHSSVTCTDGEYYIKSSNGISNISRHLNNHKTTKDPSAESDANGLER